MMRLTLLLFFVRFFVEPVHGRVGQQRVTYDHVFGDAAERLTDCGREFFVRAVGLRDESGLVDRGPQFNLFVTVV